MILIQTVHILISKDVWGLQSCSTKNKNLHPFVIIKKTNPSKWCHDCKKLQNNCNVVLSGIFFLMFHHILYLFVSMNYIVSIYIITPHKCKNILPTKFVFSENVWQCYTYRATILANKKIFILLSMLLPYDVSNKNLSPLNRIVSNSCGRVASGLEKEYSSPFKICHNDNDLSALIKFSSLFIWHYNNFHRLKCTT